MARQHEAWADTIRKEDVRGRHEAGRLAATDRRAALAVARAIRHPWYRCQALAEVARELRSRDEQDAVLREAVDAAFEQTEPNRIVRVACWPLRVVVDLERSGISVLVRRLLQVIAMEPHGLRRLDGLAAILGSVMPLPDLRGKVLPAFIGAAAASSGWRTERIVACIATSLAAHERAEALRLLDSRVPNRFEMRARADIGIA